jgi:hypothetical protein
VTQALAIGGLRLDGQPEAYTAHWRRAGLVEATASSGGLRALAAEDSGSDARVIEP